MGGGSGAHWELSTPKALTLESPLLLVILALLEFWNNFVGERMRFGQKA